MDTRVLGYKRLQQRMHVIFSFPRAAYPRIFGAGIPSMFSLINISSLHRILMNILQLLPKHLFVLDKLRMRSLFPTLIIPILAFVFLTEKRQLLQQTLGTSFFQVVDQLAGCVGFETRQFQSQVFYLYNHV